MGYNLKNLPPFYVGQKVVCVDDILYNPVYLGEISGVIKGNIYVVEYCIYEDKVWYVKVKTFKLELDSPTFRPLTESPFPSLTMSRVIGKESLLISMN